MQNLEQRIDKAKELLTHADYILIGAGAGLSSSAGFEYGGKTFEKYFEDFLDKYKITDMYSGGFYPFKTSEEKWAFWSRMVYVNRYKSKANKLYVKLFDLVKNKQYFVITTNVDHQFQLAGFDKNKLFYTQGDYGLFQCSVPCHNKTYDNKELILKMVKEQKDMRIPTALIPKCPVCGREMEMNLRADDKFVQDEGWYQHAKLYRTFLEKMQNKNVVLLEIGVGFNTPSIIKYPFEQITYSNKKAHLIRINKDYPFCANEIKNKTILFDEDIDKVVSLMLK